MINDFIFCRCVVPMNREFCSCCPRLGFELNKRYIIEDIKNAMGVGDEDGDTTTAEGDVDVDMRFQSTNPRLSQSGWNEDERNEIFKSY